MLKLKNPIELTVTLMGLYSIYLCLSFYLLIHSGVLGKESSSFQNYIITTVFLISTLCWLRLKKIVPALLTSFAILLYFSYQFSPVVEIHWSFMLWSYLFFIGVYLTSNNLKTIHPYMATLFWIVYSLSYFGIGCLKLSNNAFLSGESMFHFFKWNEEANLFPTVLYKIEYFKILAHALAITQISSILLVFTNRGRKVLWLLITIFHINIS
ncbi:MAG: hypothetical protein K2Q18_13745, partial [Bdellovibrionales bacterium]|nr:hypothetical protein [Bdellovibrionales bacterium]